MKPANIIRTAGGYKLIDFGVARAPRAALAEPVPAHASEAPVLMASGAREPSAESAAADPARTRRATVATGTLGYVDPECTARNLPASPASDLYALGATLFGA